MVLRSLSWEPTATGPGAPFHLGLWVHAGESFQLHLHCSCAWVWTSALLVLTLHLSLAMLVPCLTLGTLSLSWLPPRGRGFTSNPVLTLGSFTTRMLLRYWRMSRENNKAVEGSGTQDLLRSSWGSSWAMLPNRLCAWGYCAVPKLKKP